MDSDRDIPTFVKLKIITFQADLSIIKINYNFGLYRKIKLQKKKGKLKPAVIRKTRAAKTHIKKTPFRLVTNIQDCFLCA
jgi:hypothetical protein